MTRTRQQGRSLPANFISWVQAALVVATALLTACGGGSGAGGTDSRDNAVTLSADVYPLAVGDRRTWRVNSSLLAGTPARSERVRAEQQSGLRTVLVVASDWGEVEYLERNATGVTTVPGPNADALSLAAGPIDLLRFGQVAGTTVEMFNRTLAVDIDSDGRVDSVDLRIESTFIGYESVTTAAGVFAGAARVLTVAHITVRLGGQPQAATVTITAEEWFAPGVGPVRSVTTTSQDGVPPWIETDELLAYGVGSRRSETVAPALLSSSPAADSVLTTTPPVVLNFSEPLDPLTLNGFDGLMLVNAAGQAVAATSVVSEAGTRITLTPQAALPDGRYEIRLGSALTDLANNPLPPTVRAFTLDTRGPRIVTSTPAQGSEEAATSGVVSLRFSEPVFARGGGSQVEIFVQDFVGTQYLRGVIQGTDIVATLTTPLQRSREYTLGVYTPLVDAVGNGAPYDGTSVTFRTDPGPLARPTALMDNVEVGAVATGDINGDGRSDIVFAGHVIGTSDDYFIATRLQQADGHYAAAVRLYRHPEFKRCLAHSIALADFNGDGRIDMALAGCSGGLTVLIQQAVGGFVSEVASVDFNAWHSDAVDLDGDGRSEIVATQAGDFRFLRRSAAGVWSVALAVDSGSPYIADFRLADLNGDGQRDLVWVRTAPDTANYELAWALRQGNGFSAVRSQATSVTSSFALALAVADVTGDGRPDVLLLLRQGSTSLLTVFAQMPAGDLAPPVAHASYYDAATVDTADVDGDGRLDVLVTHSTHRQLGVYLQAENGTLQPERRFETGYAYYDHTDPVVVADLNADGRKDVVVGADVLLGRPVAGAWPAAVPALTRPVALATETPPTRPCLPAPQAASRRPMLRGAARLLQQALARQPVADATAAPSRCRTSATRTELATRG